MTVLHAVNSYQRVRSIFETFPEYASIIYRNSYFE